MKTIYDLLNQVKVDTEDIEVTPLTDLEKASMKKNFRRSVNHTAKRSSYRWAAVAACMACVVCFSQTAFAKSALNGILQNINLGHNSVAQIDPSSKPTSKLYDKNGKPITIKPDTPTEIYDDKGHNLGMVTITHGNGGSDGIIDYKDLNSAVKQLAFTSVVPKQLPAGYAFDHAALFKDKDGKPSGNYLELFYKNAEKTLHVSERSNTKETTYALTTEGNVEKTTINGHTAAFVDDHELIWDVNGINIAIQSNDMTRNELLAFAKTIA